MGYKLHQAFLGSGLPTPHMQLDSPVGGGPDWAGHDHIAATIRSMLPLVLKSGVATAKEVDIDTLADRLRAETVAAGGVVKAGDLVSAWSRKRRSAAPSPAPDPSPRLAALPESRGWPASIRGA